MAQEYSDLPVTDASASPTIELESFDSSTTSQIDISSFPALADLPKDRSVLLTTDGIVDPQTSSSGLDPFTSDQRAEAVVTTSDDLFALPGLEALGVRTDSATPTETRITLDAAALLAAFDSTSPLASIDWGSKVEVKPIDVYFAPQGAEIDGFISAGWTSYELTQAVSVLAQLEAVTNVDFRGATSSAGAEFRLMTADFGDPTILGLMVPPGEDHAGFAAFNFEGYGWDWDFPGIGGLERGGLGYTTILHEFGHGLGLAQPHDEGGTSTIMEGVTEPFNSFGVGDLNQGVFTTMSYNPGWILGPAGLPTEYPNYGLEGSYGPLDLAVLQDKYGANTTLAPGDDSYILPGANGLTTFFQAIWDTGGTDEIVASSTLGVVIDLRSATLLQETGGGGFVSYLDGVRGGYTIANGVEIENARGDQGDDTITGNRIGNLLYGLAGSDILDGGAGNDTLRPGLDADTITGGADADQIRGGLTDLDGDRITDFEDGDAVVLEGAALGAGGVSLAAGSAIFSFDSDGDGTPDATLTLEGDFGDALFEITAEDGETWVTLAETGAVGLSGQNDRFITTSDDGLRVFGGDGDDALVGGAGADLLSGGEGADLLIGGAGADTLIGGGGSDLLDGGADGDLFVFSAADVAGPDFAVDQVISGYELGVDRVEFGGFADTPFDESDLTMGDGNLTLQLSATGFIVFQGVTEAAALLADFSYADDAQDYGVIGLANLQILSGDNDRFITVDDTANEVRGGGGDDALIGAAGDDTLLGEAGSDLLIGGAGADELVGGGGNDQLRGGDDADLFVFRASDDAPGGFVVDFVDDYTAGEDSFLIEGYTGFSFFDETRLADDGVNVTISLADDRFLILRGIADAANVLPDDFQFV